jgi:phage shock protein PspC (stress-responsive transcriptional regulator)
MLTQDVDGGGSAGSIITSEEVESLKEEYLKSDLHAKIVQGRLDIVIYNYPEVKYDKDVLESYSNSKIDVRYKWDVHRSLNEQKELEYMANDSNTEHGRNTWLRKVAEFIFQYIYALKYDNRDAEMGWFTSVLRDVGDELGYISDIGDVGKAFLQGVGKGFAGIINFGVGLFRNVVGGVAEGLGIDPKTAKVVVYGLLAAGIATVSGVIIYKVSKRKSETNELRKEER